MLEEDPEGSRHCGERPSLPSLLEAIGGDPRGEGGEFMRRLADQFTAAVADGKLESSMAMLAGCPELAKMPCRKAFFSALHWSCANVSLAPVTRALLSLGCDPLGFPSPEQGAEGRHNSPIRWAASSGNLPALSALLGAGARPDLEDLMEACRNAQGACAMAIVEAAPELDPFAPAVAGGACCFDALREAAASLRCAVNDKRLQVDEALGCFEALALARQLPAGPRGDDSGSRRL